jgi:hypothetical protein
MKAKDTGKLALKCRSGGYLRSQALGDWPDW